MSKATYLAAALVLGLGGAANAKETEPEKKFRLTLYGANLQEPYGLTTKDGKTKMNLLGMDLELKVADWFRPFVRGEVHALGYDLPFLPYNSQSAAEVGAGLQLRLYEDKDTTVNLSAYCAHTTAFGDYCFAGPKITF